MPKKRHTATHEAALLDLVIGAIEDAENDHGHTEALTRLLRHGPVVCHERDPEPAALLRLELLAFLRSIVRDSADGRESYAGIELSRIRLTARVNSDRQGRVQLSASGAARDLVKLQLVTLLQMVGLRNVRQCAAPDCQRIFVKQYRREFARGRGTARSRAKRLAVIHQRERQAQSADDERN